MTIGPGGTSTGGPDYYSDAGSVEELPVEQETTENGKDGEGKEKGKKYEKEETFLCVFLCFICFGIFPPSFSVFYFYRFYFSGLHGFIQICHHKQHYLIFRLSLLYFVTF